MEWPWRPKRPLILTLCTANVCRSPMAEALLLHHLAAAGRKGMYRVRSAGTRAAQPGRRPDPRVKGQLARRNVRLPRIRAAQATAHLVDEARFVLVMDNSHLDDLRDLLGVDTLPGHIRLLGAYLEQGGPGQEIDDPYFGDPAGFTAVGDQLDAAVRAFVALLDTESIHPGNA